MSSLIPSRNENKSRSFFHLVLSELIGPDLVAWGWASWPVCRGLPAPFSGVVLLCEGPKREDFPRAFHPSVINPGVVV